MPADCYVVALIKRQLHDTGEGHIPYSTPEGLPLRSVSPDSLFAISCPRGVYNADTTLCSDSIPPGDVYQSLMKNKEQT